MLRHETCGDQKYRKSYLTGHLFDSGEYLEAVNVAFFLAYRIYFSLVLEVEKIFNDELSEII